MTEPRVPERQGLELSFVRGRWLAAAAMAVLLPLSGYDALVSGLLVAGVILANAAVWRISSRVETLQAQQRLGVAAVVLDSAIVLSAGLTAPEGAATTAFGALVIVVAEASVRWVPLKAIAATVAMIAALAAAMALRHTLVNDRFDAPEYLVIAVLALLIGTIVGSAVREVYRQRVASTPPAPTREAPDIPEEALAQLTPRERQVLSLIVGGYSNAAIAEALIVEPKTIKNHINRIYAKLELNSRYEAITSVLGTRTDRPNAP